MSVLPQGPAVLPVTAGAAGQAPAAAKPSIQPKLSNPVPFSGVQDKDILEITGLMNQAEAGIKAQQAAASQQAATTPPSQLPKPPPTPQQTAAPAPTQQTPPPPSVSNPAEPKVALPSPEAPDPKTMTWQAIHASARKVQEERARLKEEFAQMQKAREAAPVAAQAQGVQLDPSELKARPIAALAKLGLNMNDVIKAAIAEHNSAQQAPQAQQLAALPEHGNSEIAQLKAKIEAMEQRSKDLEFQQLRNSMVNEFKAQIARPENALLGAIPNAHEVMLANAAKYAELSGGEVLTPDKVAATMVSEVQESITTLFSNPAVKQFLASKGLLGALPAVPNAGAIEQAIPQFGIKPPATLTNQVVGSNLEEAAGSDIDFLQRLSQEIKPLADQVWKTRG
jgi:hypothetical protein